MQNISYPYNMQEHVFDFKVKVNFQNGNVSLTAPQIVTPPAYFHQNSQGFLNNAQSISSHSNIPTSFIPYNPHPQYSQPIVVSNGQFSKNQPNKGNTSFNSFHSSQFQINQSLQMIQCVICQKVYHANQFDLHLQMHKNRPNYGKQKQSNVGKTQNSVNQNSFNSFHQNQYSFQDNKSVTSQKNKQFLNFTPNLELNHSISSQQHYFTKPAIQPHINDSFHNPARSNIQNYQPTNQKSFNQNSMHYSSSSNQSNQSQFSKKEMFLPNNLNNSFKNSNQSINNPNFFVFQQVSTNQIGPSFFQQSSRQNYQNSKQQNSSSSKLNNSSKCSLKNFNAFNNNSDHRQNYYLNDLNNTQVNKTTNKVNMKSIQSKYVKENVNNSQSNNSLKNNKFNIFEDQSLSSISGKSRISQQSFSSQISQFKSLSNKSDNYHSANVSLRKQMPYSQNQNEERLSRHSHKSQGNFYKKKQKPIHQNLANTVNSFNSKFQNQESSSDEQRNQNEKLSFNERLKQKQSADRQVQSMQLCQCKSVQLKSKMINSKNSKFSDQSLSKTKIPVNYLARQDFISTSSKSSSQHQL